MSGDGGSVPVFEDPTNQGVHSGSAVLAVLGANAVVCAVSIPLWLCFVRRLKPYQLSREGTSSSFSFSSSYPFGHTDLGPTWALDGSQKVDIWSLKTFARRKSFFSWVEESAQFEVLAQQSGIDTALYLAFMKIMSMLSAVVMAVSTIWFFPLHVALAKKSDLEYSAENVTLSLYEDELFARTTVQAMDQLPLVMYCHVAGIFVNVCAAVVAAASFVTICQKVVAAVRVSECTLSEKTLRIKNISRSVLVSDLEQHFSSVYPEQLEAVHLAYDVRKRAEYQRKLDKVDLKLKYVNAGQADEERAATGRRHTDSGGQLDVIGEASWQDTPNDSSETSTADGLLRWTSKSEQNDATRIERLRKRRQEILDTIRRWEKKLPDSAGFAHVVFNSPIIRNLAVRSKTVHVNGQRLSISRAHLPGDINWSEVGKSRTACAVLVNVIMMLGLIFFTTPTAIFTAFQEATQNVKGIRDFFSDLSDVSESSSGSFIFQYLPVLTYLLLSLTLPLLIEWVTKRQPQISYFEMRQLVMKRLFLYFVMGTFVLPSIALSTMSGIIALFRSSGEEDSRFDRSLHHLFLPGSGAFFVNLLQVYATVGNLYELWRPIELISYFIDKFWNRYNEDDCWRWVDEFEFAWQYPLVLSCFAIAFNFSVFVPLSSVAFFCMMFSKTLIHNHHSRTRLFSRRNALDAAHCGRLVKTLVVMFYLSLDLALVFAVCFFVFRSEAGAFIPHTILILALLIFTLGRTVSYAKQHSMHFVTTSHKYDQRLAAGINLHLGESDEDDERLSSFESDDDEATDATADTHDPVAVRDTPMSPTVVPHSLYSTPFYSRLPVRSNESEGAPVPPQPTNSAEVELLTTEDHNQLCSGPVEI
ncbi:hypothetical protein DIPPA_70191 [Diplonema papillatum]|nr:hypothetical protein DIPPA_70191 [Diplonema papillatum]